ncbi:hypothetical protein TNCV_3466791 [Trichonephila clavipes]|nr:hypothetical protein TNCV_3466791 [Trichonephila clavipes]
MLHCRLSVVVGCTSKVAAGVHYRLFSVWTLVPVRLGKQLSGNSTVDEIASEEADCRLTYTMANCPQRRDEAHFWLNGYVNKRNCRIWSEANPQVYVETPLHPEKLTVWCALWAGGILLQKR